MSDSPFPSAAAHADVQTLAPAVPIDDDVRRAQETLPPPHPSLPSPSLKVWTAHVRYERRRDPRTRAFLFDEYADYARGLARSMYRGGTVTVEELEQVAFTAVLSALERFEPDRRLPFRAFARPTIIGYLKRHYRDLGWAVRVPRRLQEITTTVRQASDRLTQELARVPEPAELAADLAVDVGLIRAAAVATRQRALVSLDAPLGAPGAPDGWSEFGNPDPNMVGVENRMALTSALADMNETDRQLIGMYFFEEMTQTEIGGHLGISQMQVSRQLSRIILRLREQLVA